MIVIGASAGGISPLCKLVADLPGDLPATIFVAVHVGAHSHLPEVLRRHARLPVCETAHKQSIDRSCIYVAPSQVHLVIHEGYLSLTHGPRENGHRPSIDLLFRSAAQVFRDRVVGVILSGSMDDGAAGLFAIKARGGITMVQDPAEADVPDMPFNAMRYNEVDHCLPVEKIAASLVRLVRDNGNGKPKAKSRKKALAESPRLRPPPKSKLVAFSCPECQGPMTETRTGNLAQYECEVGHRFSPESLTQVQAETLERALWISLRTLVDRKRLHETLALRAKAAGNVPLMERMQEVAVHAESDVGIIREVIERF